MIPVFTGGEKTIVRWKLHGSIFPETRLMVKNIIDRLWEETYITKKLKLYLTGPIKPRPRQFYTLSNIHKNRKDWSDPFKIPPGRQIVSDCESETYNTGEYIDNFLNPPSIKHPSYIKDTYDLIGKIRKFSLQSSIFLQWTLRACIQTLRWKMTDMKTSGF